MPLQKTRSSPKRPKAGKKDAPPAAAKSGKRSPLLRFGILFALSCTIIYIVLAALPLDFLAPIDEHTAWSLRQALRTAGMNASIQGSVVSAGGFAVSIIPECTPIFAIGLYLSFVMAYPASAGVKLAGLAAGIPGIWAANLVRLALVFVAGYHYRNLFNAVHVYFGQVFTACVVFAACMIWLNSMPNENGPKHSFPKPAGFLLRFAAVSTVAFFVWLHINPRYMWLVDQCIRFIFSLFGRELVIPRSLGVYYYTFNVVVFASLILATRSAAWRRKAKVFATGLCLIFLVHVCYRACNVLITAYSVLAFAKVTVMLSTAGQYLLPVLFWLALVAPGWYWPAKSLSRPFPASK